MALCVSFPKVRLKGNGNGKATYSAVQQSYGEDGIHEVITQA